MNTSINGLPGTQLGCNFIPVWSYILLTAEPFAASRIITRLLRNTEASPRPIYSVSKHVETPALHSQTTQHPVVANFKH
jgi:hypothetical protein